MNDYEAKQERRRERLERAAERATGEADRRFTAARAATAGIEFGQPILVDHHSAGRHRAALRRSDNHMRKGIEAGKQAQELARRAEAVGSGGISSDDPDAVTKLQAKCIGLEHERDVAKALNAYWRKHRTLVGCSHLSAEAAERLTAKQQTMTGWDAKHIVPPYHLQNIGAEIRRIKARIDELGKRDPTAEASTETIGGATVTIDPAENRVYLRFDARLSKEDYQRVRRYGFVWARSVSAFSRKLTNSAIYAAREAARLLGASSEGTQ